MNRAQSKIIHRYCQQFISLLLPKTRFSFPTFNNRLEFARAIHQFREKRIPKEMDPIREKVMITEWKKWKKNGYEYKKLYLSTRLSF